MSGRLAVDFGTSNTLVAVWDENKLEGVPFHLPDFGRLLRQGAEEISVIPSVIHYTSDKRRWIGDQVIQRNLYQSERTFRWMKRYISQRSPIKVNIDGKEITPYTAGQDFLSTLLIYAVQELGIQDEEIALSVPVEAYEHYEDWLGRVAENAKLPRFRLIDEPSAAALGYGAHIQPGNAYLIFDFGGGTMHASIILIEPEESVKSGRRCRVLGKAGRDIGGTTIDQWLFEEILRQNGRHDYEDEICCISNKILVSCEEIKEKLSFVENANIHIENPSSGLVIKAEFSRNSFEELLDSHDLFTEINHTIRSAFNTAREYGYREDDIRAALMVGGSSQIPSVQKTLRQIFDKEKVLFNRPLDAVVRGAAAFAAGVDFYDHIQHDYSIRYRNPVKSDYDYRTIIKRGTPYPSHTPVARLNIKAAYDGQTKLGIAIFEIGANYQRNPKAVELVFDTNGAAKLMPISIQEHEQRTFFWMNEHNPTFLTADPPACQGEARFEVIFSIDQNKRLIITTRDLKSGNLIMKDYPVVKLT